MDRGGASRPFSYMSFLSGVKSILIDRMHKQPAVRSTFFFLLLAGVAVLTFFIFKPYLITLAVASTFAVVMQPLYRAILNIVRGQRSIASILTIVATSILIMAPLTLLGMQVVQEATGVYETISEQQEELSDDVLVNVERLIEGYVRPYIPSFNLDLVAVLRQSLGWVTAHIGPVFSNTLQGILQFFLGLVAFYYLLKDGPSFIQTFIKLSPLTDANDRRIMQRLNTAINSIITGTLMIAVVQGVASGVGFWMFGVPSATLWGGAAALGALVPGVGTTIVLVPAVIYLFITGNTFQAIGLIIWGALAVGSIDNFLGPMLVGRGVRIHPMLILFSVLGGIAFFGPVGFILGPLVLSLLYALLDIYVMMGKGYEKTA